MRILRCNTCSSNQTIPMYSKQDHKCKIICLNCSILGPTKQTKFEAVAAWNKEQVKIFLDKEKDDKI
jgi:hypothetical protein